MIPDLTRYEQDARTLPPASCRQTLRIQRAFVAAAYAGISRTPILDVANLLDVTVRSVRQARIVLASGSTWLIKSVLSGGMSLSRAVTEAPKARIEARAARERWAAGRAS